MGAYNKLEFKHKNSVLSIKLIKGKRPTKSIFKQRTQDLALDEL